MQLGSTLVAIEAYFLIYFYMQLVFHIEICPLCLSSEAKALGAL